jgi:thiamine phosphate synthase YjbQ (UPF0047 family)
VSDGVRRCDGLARTIVVVLLAVPVVDGALTFGEFGCIYFADFDHSRTRERTV